MPRFLLVGLLLLSGPAMAAGQDARTLSARIEERISARWTRENVSPTPPTDDASFFRRLSLDLNGRIPSVVQLRDFLDDRRPEKRRLWIDELLNGRDNRDLYVNHMTHVWRRTLLANTPAQPFGLSAPLEGWLRKQLKANTPYDKLVQGLLTNPEASSFFQAHENKPENVASAASRLFLGVKLECAQCHNHPFARWTRQQFWEQAAFFASLANGGVRANGAVVRMRPENDEGPTKIKIGDSDAFAEARFLDGKSPSWGPGARPRTVLADWITARDNPWFARAAVNRIWHHLFGVGLVEPIDGFGTDDAAPSHPELLDELADAFVAHNYDIKYLISAICATQTYQLSSRQTHPGQSDGRLFARAQPRGMYPEQLFESLTFATGYLPKRSPGGDASLYGPDTLQSQFLARFEEGLDHPAEAQASIPQALMLMNGKLIDEATTPERSRTLSAVLAGGPQKPPTKRIEELFLVTLSRRPRPEEAARFVTYVTNAKDEKQAIRDVFWALLNSTEFVLNH